MKKIVKENLKLERYTLPREEAIRFMQKRESRIRWSLSGICRRMQNLAFSGRENLRIYARVLM